MSRTLIRTLDLPKGSPARALAEGIVDQFNVASISGSAGAHEVQFVSPASLVVVINSSRARFFVDSGAEGDDEDDEDDEDDDDPHDVAEEVSNYLARCVGLLKDDDGEDASQDKPPVDDSDRIAELIVAQMLERGWLELTSSRSRISVEQRLAHCLDKGLRSGEAICEALSEVPGVAEIFVTDEDLEALVAKLTAPKAPLRMPTRSVRKKKK